MIIDHPRPTDIPHLRQLWQQAFGDSDGFLDDFFRTGFSYRRCRCLWKSGVLSAALYWFDAQVEGEKAAYLYAIATEKSFRGQGLCHLLMASTHAHLLDQGYALAVLLPGSEALEKFYAGMGYRSFGNRSRSSAPAPEEGFGTPVTVYQYRQVRQALLPKGAVAQTGAFYDFLRDQAVFYAGEDFAAAVSRQAPQVVLEYLPAQAVPEGEGRIAGMYLPLTENAPAPQYLGLAME